MKSSTTRSVPVLRPQSAAIRRSSHGLLSLPDEQQEDGDKLALRRTRDYLQKQRQEDEELKLALIREEKQKFTAAQAKVTQANAWSKALALTRSYRSVMVDHRASATARGDLRNFGPSVGDEELRVEIYENDKFVRTVSVDIFLRQHEKLRKQMILRKGSAANMSKSIGKADDDSSDTQDRLASASPVKSKLSGSTIGRSGVAPVGAPGRSMRPQSAHPRSRAGGMGLSSSQPVLKSGRASKPRPTSARAEPGLGYRIKDHINSGPSSLGMYTGNVTAGTQRPTAQSQVARDTVESELRAVLVETAQLTELLQHQLRELKLKGWNRETAPA